MRESSERTIQHLTVSEAEAGQKLLAYLKRRLGQALPEALLHRIIRSGQVRLNGKRAQAFTRLESGDEVRIPPLRLDSPPLAAANIAEAEHDPAAIALSGQADACPAPPHTPPPASPPCLCIVAETPEYLLLNKPAGLPSQPGSKHQDSLSARLAAAYAAAPFAPTLAHRLDKATSGLLLAAKTYRALRAAQEALREHSLAKDYLAWVEGAWPECATVTLHDLLAKQLCDGREKVVAGEGKEALCLARPILMQGKNSLLLVRLLTGRTHQIRVQLASRGHPIAGDVKYGGQPTAEGMLLHAWRLILPDGQIFAAPPPWQGGFAVDPRALDSLPITI